VDKPLKSITHCQCNARLTVTLPAAKSHWPLANTILYCLVTRGTKGVNNLPSHYAVVPQRPVEPTICWSNQPSNPNPLHHHVVLLNAYSPCSKLQSRETQIQYFSGTVTKRSHSTTCTSMAYYQCQSIHWSKEYKNSSGDEIANVNFCTTTTYMEKPAPTPIEPLLSTINVYGT